jgi:hypothetical protein
MARLTAAQRLAERKRARAVTLRTVTRYTWQQVADAPLPCDLHMGQYDSVPPGCPLCIPHLYASRAAAHKAVTEALARDYSATEADRDRLRSEQLATLDVLLAKAISDARLSEGPADRARAMTAAARLLERQAKLTGIDAPKRITVDAELDAELEAAMAELAGMPAPTAAELREAP